MLTAIQLQSLKSSNVLKDSEKAKVRIVEDYKNATKEQKKSASMLAGITNAIISNANNRGTANAKTVLGLSQIMNVSPYYYTGETDEKGECNDAVQKEFLTSLGYSIAAKGIRKNETAKKPSAKAAKAPKTTAKAEKPAAKTAAKSSEKAVSKAAKATVAKTKKAVGKAAGAVKSTAKTAAAKVGPVASEIAKKPGRPSKSKDLSLNEILTLVEALHIRSALSPDAKEKLEGIKKILTT